MTDIQPIIQNMLQEHNSCSIINEGNDTTVILRPKEIENSLKDKISDDDILMGMDIINKQLQYHLLQDSLYRSCDGICNYCNKCSLRAIPNGNLDANVMFVSKAPTEYEIGNTFSHCDKNAVFISLILSKMNVSRSSVYFTDIIKCNQNLDSASFEKCINHYLIEEINIINPKVIICDGLSVLKTFIKVGILKDLPANVTYGNIYTAKTRTDKDIKIVAIYDIETVLKKTGDEYSKCKNELWSQILNAFKASV